MDRSTCCIAAHDVKSCLAEINPINDCAKRLVAYGWRQIVDLIGDDARDVELESACPRPNCNTYSRQNARIWQISWVRLPTMRSRTLCKACKSICSRPVDGAQADRANYTVRIIPAQFVKPFVKSNKNDARDAEAIAEAVIRPTMRFVEIKPCALTTALHLCSLVRYFAMSSRCRMTLPH